MSMLTAQIKELRLMGDGQAAKGEFAVATLLLEAADTIESLRDGLPKECAECAEGMGHYGDTLCDPLKQRIAELEEQRDVLLRCLENDYGIKASWDGLRKLWCIELTEEGVRMRDAKVVG